MPADGTRASTRAQVVKYGKTRIDVTAGPDAGAVIDMAGALVRVGTAADNDLVLRDDTVSRRHCEIESGASGVRVRDVGSTNGVWVGGIRILDAVIGAPLGSTTLTLGDTQLTITRLDETVERLQATSSRFGDVLGASPRMRELFADLDRIAATDLTLLIEGETGTGKDAIAEAVHRASARTRGPFVVFDCGAVAPSLAESELFGHERGAFTGAIASRAGVFEEAEGGTLFLDEIGELPRDLQPKLLRALEKREVRRLGSSKTVGVDVRIIAATNRKMTAEVARGTFREDLYFRLAGTHVTVPPLRERISDLPVLVEHFLSLEDPPRSAHEVGPEVWEMLDAHRWPGNVRELRNAVRRLFVTPEHVLAPGVGSASSGRDPERLDPPSNLLPLRIARREASDGFERHYVAAVLRKTGGNVSRGASIAEVSRQMLQKLMRKHGLAAGVPAVADETPPSSAQSARTPSRAV
jgi:transcriptional regulator with GAF, ATPase, and Fis domain